ncbi:glycosyltransferase family 90 protein [Boletus reticuloceps]|uniref:Glycosyltransferase family 90 protein n=1 Tax=Boletus reticuloceps TaxID=495285 RepID=A0A8I2YYF8_9AGAM|nr:glycosyltransferase family 90 protein [Boletus reticuloceps]
MALEAAANGTSMSTLSFHSRAQTCLQSQNAAGFKDVLPTRLPVSTRPHSRRHPYHSRLHLPRQFIASHRDTMNPCMHPSLLATHGQFLRYETGPFPETTLVPRFSLCGTVLHHDIRPPVPYGWDFDSDPEPEENEEDGGGAFEEDLPWEHKANERLDWRGRTTGIYASPDSWWGNGHRQRLVTLANSLEGNVSVLRAPESGMEYEVEATPVGEPESVPFAQINPSWMNVAFTDKPIACDQGTCDEMTRIWPFLEVQGKSEEGQYKFILDVDGNGWSGRFKRLITSNALIFKATIYPEWYTSRIAPWVHYVPIQVSYADLYDAVAFFREHDALASRIARAGRAWSRRYWRRTDMTAYLYR